MLIINILMISYRIGTKCKVCDNMELVDALLLVDFRYLKKSEQKLFEGSSEGSEPDPDCIRGRAPTVRSMKNLCNRSQVKSKNT